MATWSDVGADNGMQPPGGGADNNGYGDDFPGGDPWRPFDGEEEGRERTSDGWSWNDENVVNEGKDDDKDHEMGSQGMMSSTSSRRRRGKRGSGGGGKAAQQPRWRSGQVPFPPEFDGDVEANPFCLRHYKRALQRWVRITKEFLPPNEQALRALDMMKGAAALEFEEVDDERYDKDDGIKFQSAPR